MTDADAFSPLTEDDEGASKPNVTNSSGYSPVSDVEQERPEVKT
jgi:hypothetical protein